MPDPRPYALIFLLVTGMLPACSTTDRRMGGEETMSNGDSERIVSDDGSGEATAAYVARRLRELAVEADDVIASAASAADRSPADLHEIYREAWWELHLRLGDGAIGPATAAAAPLLSEKQSVLATRLGISEGIRDRFDWSVGRELPNLGPIGRDIETNAAPIFWS